MTEIQFCKSLYFVYIGKLKIQGTYFKTSALYFKIYGLYFLRSPMCFFMDVIMSKKREFSLKNATLIPPLAQ